MKTLVIHPADNTTDFLKSIYIGKDWKVITYNPSKKELTNAIKDHERIIMLGHGDQHGLYGFNRMIIESKWVYLLREKICICIWCHADQFFRRYNLKGFTTGMFISDFMEANLYCVQASDSEINESNTKFALSMKNCIDSSDLLANLSEEYNTDNDLVKYNKNQFFQKWQ